MHVLELERRIDRLFDLAAHAEPAGWDFALAPGDIGRLMASGTPLFQQTFNGLVLPPARRHAIVRRVHLLVFPERSLLDAVIAAEERAGEPGAVIVTHHPVDMETARHGFLPVPPAQLERLFELGVGLLVLHAPLDCHREVSTSGALADALGLRRVGTFAPYVGGDCGVLAEGEEEPFAEFAERVRVTCELPWFRADAIRFSGRAVRRVAVVAGGGDDVGYLRQAEAMGADTYLAGHWWTPHAGVWCDENRRRLRDAIGAIGMNLLSASHDGSELVVFRDRLLPLFAGWGLETRLWRQADHWR